MLFIVDNNINDNPNNKWIVLFTVCLGVMIISLNMSITNVSLPAISEYFTISLNQTEWVITSYFITYVGLVTLFADIGNFKGHGRIFSIGILLFLISSILCSISPSIDFLIGSRLLQGLAASMILAGPLVIIEYYFPTNMLGRAMGVYGMMVAIGLGLGPVVGGLVQDFFGWRAIFLVNIPVCLIVLPLSIKYVQMKINKPLHVNFLGGFLELIAVALIIYTLSIVELGDYIKASLYGIISIILVISFLYVEKRSDSPMVNWGLLKNFTFTSFNVSFHVLYICEYVLLYVLPFYTEKILGISSSMTGMVLSAAPIVMIVFTPISGYIADKIGSILPVVIGFSLSIISFLLLLTLNEHSTILELVVYYTIMGIGIAFAQAPINKVVMSIVSINNKTSASSILTLFRSMGIAMASSYGSIILSLSIPEGLLTNTIIRGSGIPEFLTGMDNIFIFGIILLAVMLLLMIRVKIKVKDRKSIIGKL